jgi:hypothetical protein
MFAYVRRPPDLDEYRPHDRNVFVRVCQPQIGNRILGQQVANRQIRSHINRKRFLELLYGLLVDGNKQIFLVPEVQINAALGTFSFARNSLDRGIFESMLAYQLFGSSKDAITASATALVLNV